MWSSSAYDRPPNPYGEVKRRPFNRRLRSRVFSSVNSLLRDQVFGHPGIEECHPGEPVRLSGTEDRLEPRPGVSK